MSRLAKYGSWACVAGAAEGLGAAFSTQLAKRGFNLILIDTNEKALSYLKEDLVNQFSIDIIPMIHDLGNRSCLDPIMSNIEKSNAQFLVYNAAYGPVRPFLSNSPEQLDTYLKINMETPLHLAHRFCQLHRQQKAGMLWLSSLAGFRGTQYVVPYAATKAFSWNIAEGLHYEFKNSGLDFSVCCPGTIDTPAFRSTQPNPYWLAPKPMSPKLVAKEALDKFGTRIFIIPGFSNKLAHFIFSHLLPRKWASGFHNAVMRRIYKQFN